MDDDVTPADVDSREDWRQDITESLTDSGTYGHHSAPSNVQPKHSALLKMKSLWCKLDRVVIKAYTLRKHSTTTVNCAPRQLIHSSTVYSTLIWIYVYVYTSVLTVT